MDIHDLAETFRALSDSQLLVEGPILVQRERTSTVTLVAWLAEVEARTLYRAQGFSCLSHYCSQHLGMSTGAANRRIGAAKAALRFPLILERLADGSVSMTNVNLLSPSMTEDNHRLLLDAASHKTRREVESQVAALHPEKEEVITVVLRMPRKTFDKMRRAQDLLRHAVPNGNVVEVVDRALSVLITDVHRRKLAQVKRPRPARSVSAGSRRVPAAVRRAVSERDENRCAFVGEQGRCTETGMLDFHHVKPVVHGGRATVENIQLRCRAHNQYEAEQDLGPPAFARQQQPSDRRRKNVPRR
jgi:hypothetical protein